MSDSPSISFAITASTEHHELELLLRLLHEGARDCDEVVVQVDSLTVTDAVKNVVAQYKNISIVEFPLDNHFGNFKNNLKSKCSKDYIFQIDADELPHSSLIDSLPKILETYPDIGLFHVPRINTVEGISRHHLEKWKWTMSEKGWINWPDYQPRLFKNSPDITWELPVHETITNYKTASFFPASEEYCLYHPKGVQRQEKQNALYEAIHNES